MTQEQLSLFEAFALPLVGLPVSHVWQGHGSAIFLEFGTLTPSTRTRRDGSLCNPTGELGLMIEWSWRIEGKRSILCGSWAEKRCWPRALACLAKASVINVALFGRLPELDPALSNGAHVVSFMTAQGEPAWTLFDRRGSECRWLQVQRGRLCVGAARDHATFGTVSD